MKVMIATEYRIVVSDGRYFVYKKFKDIAQRYYNTFGPFTLCSRFIKCEHDDKMYDITNYILNIVEISLYKTFFFLNYSYLSSVIKEHDLIIGRFDSIVSCRTAKIAKRLRIPFLAEVMADAWDGYWNHGLLGKLLAPYMYLSTKIAIYHSDYAIYVTERFLQNRYPCKNPSISASNVNICKSDYFFLEEKLKLIERSSLTDIVMVTTAAVDVVAKGQEFVIKAIPQLNKYGIFVKYILIGGGDKSRLYKLAQSLGIEDSVEFVGEKTINEIIEILKKAHLYIQPSLQEGLPRSVIEAMSCACPVIGANTAGIPELINPNCVFKRKSVNAIVKTIHTLLSSKPTMKKIAKQNFDKAGEYTIEKLDARRNTYFSKIINNIENTSK